jgi:predicted ATPase
MPYGIVRDMFAYRFDILESDSAATALEKFRSGMAEILPDNHIDLVGHLIGFDFSTSPAVQKMIGSPDFGRLALTYLNNYVRALAARQPVMIFLEDLHWSDDSSLDLLESLVNAIPRVRLLLVGLLRPTLFERRPHWGEGQAAFGQLELKLLSRRASHALMEEILQKVDHVPDALRDLIIEGAEGNPYYMEELIKMLVDEGVIDRGAEAQNAWHISQGRLEQIRVPPTLTGILQARLDNLPHLEKNVLQRAAIVGKVFWDMLVAELAQEEHEKLDIALKSIRARELIFLRERSSFADTSEYIFKHALLRDVAYETVLLKLRRGYHAQVARWLEMHAGERIGEYAGLIAEHLEQAGQSSAAAAYLRQAGEKMMETGTLREALNFFRRALALLSEENLERGKLQVQIGDALMQLGNFGEAHQQLEAGLSTARLLGDKGTCAAALDNLGWIAREQGDWVQARLYLEDGLALARETNDRSRIAHILYTLSWVEVAQSKYTEAQAYLTESQSLFQSLNDRLGLTMVFNALGLVALGFNDYAQAQALHLQALALSREVVNRREEANILGNLGEDARICGDYGAARQYYQEGLTLCHEIGDKFGAARKIDNLGHTASAMGDYNAALGYYREALQIATDIGAVPMLLDILAGLAGVLAHTGQTEQSLELLGLALAHPGLVSDTKPIIEQTLTELRTLLSPVQIEAGMARGQALKLDTVVTELLRQAS